MILGDRRRDKLPGPDHSGGPTLDDLFRAAVGRCPDGCALIDPPDRDSFTDGAPRRLTYAQADRAVSAVASRLRSLSLPVDAVVATQLPNVTESVITFLGVLRAGMIAAPVPLLWRQADTAAALARIGARALITCRRVGSVDHADLAMHVAAETFTVRFVGGFGRDLPDGLLALDDIFDAGAEPAPGVDRQGPAAEHVAVVTFDVTAGGAIPIARNHAELIAAGAAVTAQAPIGPGTTLLGALATSSFAGLASTIVPWLDSAGTLALHQPFVPAIFAAQHADERCAVAILPGPLVPRLLEAGLIDGDGSSTVIAVWRAPERLSGSPAWPAGGPALIDVSVFGEVGLFADRRSGAGKPTQITFGAASRGGAVLTGAIDVMRTPEGTLALRGSMVPRYPFPPGAERGDRPRLRIDADGFVDTGFIGRVDRDMRTVTVDGGPAGIVSVGGYRFVLRDLQNLVAEVDEQGSLAALPDMLAGYRLAGTAADHASLCAALAEKGVNPLVIAAFRGRRSQGHSSAA